jgi:hypothetical protein
MVRPFLFLFKVPLTLHDRAFDTIHEALTVAGGSCFYMHITQTSHLIPVDLMSHIVYKYIMAGLVNPASILDGIA